MPYVIISTVGLFTNLYKNAPITVGDKDSDPELMRYLGAKITTCHPLHSNQPLYAVQATPRSIFDRLEKRGYTLLSSQTVQEHAVWILARPRLPEDDKTELQRGGPNDKAVQVGGESSKEPQRSSTASNKSQIKPNNEMPESDGSNSDNWEDT